MKLVITDPDFERFVAALDPMQDALDRLAEQMSGEVALALTNVRKEDRWLLPLMSGWETAGAIDRVIFVEAVARKGATALQRATWSEWGYTPKDQPLRPGVRALEAVLTA